MKDKPMPIRCCEALDEIRSLFAHARTDSIDMVERIQAICGRAMEAARPLADTDELLMSLVEPITKAIVFEDCGNTADWQENTNLGIAAVRAIKSALTPLLQHKEEAERERVLTDEQIRHMTDRFLMWELPRDFHPDHGISFKDPLPHLPQHWPVGTNLFSSEQAGAMVRFMVEGMKP